MCQELYIVTQTNVTLEVKKAEGISVRSLTYPCERPPATEEVVDGVWTLKSSKVLEVDNIQAEQIQRGGAAPIPTCQCHLGAWKMAQDLGTLLLLEIPAQSHSGRP